MPSVTENGVTITASASEAEIRQSAGFEEVKPTKETDGETPGPGASAADSGNSQVDPPTAASAASGDATERNPDGTFKPKPQSGDPRKSIQGKISAEVARRGEAERRAEAAEARAQALEAQLAAGTKPTSEGSGKTQPPTDPKPPTYIELVRQYETQADWPKLEDFVVAGFQDPYQAMLAAQAAFIGERQLTERDARQQRTVAERETHERRQVIHDEGAQKYPDWHDLMQSEAAQIVLPAAVVNEIEADPSLSADLMHLLLTEPDEVARLSTVHDPIAAARAITRLSMRLTAAPSGPAVSAPPQTRAKPLIKPVSASPAAPEAVPPEDLPFGPRYIAAMNAKERKERESRGA